MKRRLFIAVSIGAISFLRVAEELWFRTKMPVHGIIFWSLTVYFAGIVITYAVTDAFRIKIARKRQNPKVVTLDRKEWERETTLRKERNETRGRRCSA